MHTQRKMAHAVSSGDEPRVSSDNDLLVSVAAGDHAAFSELYDRLADRTLGLVRRTLVDMSQSEEVTQEVFLAVWQDAATFDPTKGRASTWVFTMAHRRAVDRVRASQASRNRDVAAGLRNFHPDFDSTYEAVEISVEHGRVQQALSRITRVQRETVWLSFQHQRTHNEIAELLDLPVGTIKTRLRDGLACLRRELNAVPGSH
ncbi:sigma-70 family RNA polymerase sigma factor [Marisediminicola senii]|uniref:sigma-70 family RNA polymerase sigma factor n=1 Tax=Marisediminicola senii TaxID=2711233 RepID=UPI002E27C05B|nr:sigma-70 family RNA polymerase sigma factor [Marisediminicola senii]